jgi:lipopolysaccharide/colanic/teichoic acid biosynthesis glycosyltransferase/NDP-sugar pyrophosphorylase family protein
MKAIVLVGGVSSRLSSLTHHAPRAMLTLADRPVLSYVLDHFEKNGITEFYVPLNPKLNDVRDYLESEQKKGRRLHILKESKWMGTAGAVGLLRKEFSTEPFCVLNGNSFSFFDLAPLRQAAERDPEALHLGVSKIKRVSFESSSDLFPAMFAMIVPPRIFDFIPASRYYDFREQLIPILAKKDFVIQQVLLSGYFNELKDINDYMDANFEALHASTKSEGVISNGANVSSSARLVGPVFLGKNSVIGPNTTIEGPVIIGPGCEVGEGVTIRRSILASNVKVGNIAEIRNSVVLNKASVRSHARLANTVLYDKILPSFYHMPSAALNRHSYHYGFFHHILAHRPVRIQQRLFDRFIKRSIDLFLTVASFPFWFPVTMLLGLTVKLTSRGPMFYVETRVGLHGEEFALLKLRSMVTGAHLMQVNLQAKNISDGPMFKVNNDPRVTPLGRWLRRTSLDELPQLFNVLKGEMSLVGPRPLSWKEMKWQPAWRDIRLSVLPGVTGLWQARARDSEQFSDWITMDLDYIRHWSIMLDVELILETLTSVFKRRSSN